ncbi:hypothetical protein B0H15DRAFT_846210 [Mycena belliarum]|uniref:DUF6534 domain-containing protein n=1 Tax=Mycena belliarum TaxID=1033014 RepID=A0AAD6XKX7_9AGAR|nr:hypothetical protein B0H15DRAFT_846210 [Mycena belliae]
MDSHFPLNPNLGALQIGYLTSGFLFGALTVQVLIYNRKFATDHWTLKLLVAAIWFLELGQLGCVAHASYYMTITMSGNLLAILSPPKTIGSSFLLASTVGPLVESFYVSRLLRFSGKIYPAVAGWILAFLRFGGWVFLGYHVTTMTSLDEFLNDFGWLLSMLLGLSAVVDLTISAWIAYFLARRRSATTLQSESARQLLDRVILWTLQTGVITSLAFLITLICYLILGRYLIWMAVSAIVTKVSSNCFLASLNARASTRTQGRSNNSVSQHQSQSRFSQNRGSNHNGGRSLVGSIINLYQSSDHYTSFQSIRRSGSSIGIDRSAFSPDETAVSASTRSGYWAL